LRYKRLPLLCSKVLIAFSRKLTNIQLSMVGTTKNRTNKRATKPFHEKIALEKRFIKTTSCT
jgi:hypothetical protein